MFQKSCPCEFANVTFRIQIVDIRSPFNEWSVYEDNLPVGWGIEYGSSALSKFQETFPIPLASSLLLRVNSILD